MDIVEHHRKKRVQLVCWLYRMKDRQNYRRVFFPPELPFFGFFGILYEYSEAICHGVRNVEFLTYVGGKNQESLDHNIKLPKIKPWKILGGRNSPTMTTLTRNTTHPLRWISEPVFSVPIEEGIQNVDGGFRLISTRCFHVRSLLGVCSPSAAVEKQKKLASSLDTSVCHIACHTAVQRCFHYLSTPCYLL